MFWWLPDLDDEDDEDDEDEDDDGEGKTAWSKRGATEGASRVLQNKPVTDKKLLKQRGGKIDRRAKKAGYDKIKNKKGKEKLEELDEDGGEEEEESKDSAPKKNKRVEEQKKKKKTPRG